MKEGVAVDILLADEGVGKAGWGDLCSQCTINPPQHPREQGMVRHREVRNTCQGRDLFILVKE